MGVYPPQTLKSPQNFRKYIGSQIFKFSHFTPLKRLAWTTLFLTLTLLFLIMTILNSECGLSKKKGHKYRNKDRVTGFSIRDRDIS